MDSRRIDQLREQYSQRQRQQDMQQLINSQTYTIFTLQNTINILKNSITKHPYTRKFIYSVKGMCT